MDLPNILGEYSLPACLLSFLLYLQVLARSEKSDTKFVH
jgi:hypothetical protein